MDVSQYEQTRNMMQIWTGKLSELQLPGQNPAWGGDGQGETSIPPFNFVERGVGGIISDLSAKELDLSTN